MATEGREHSQLENESAEVNQDVGDNSAPQGTYKQSERREQVKPQDPASVGNIRHELGKEEGVDEASAVPRGCSHRTHQFISSLRLR